MVEPMLSTYKALDQNKKGQHRLRMGRFSLKRKKGVLEMTDSSLRNVMMSFSQRSHVDKF
jgi:hypothetical protein